MPLDDLTHPDSADEPLLSVLVSSWSAERFMRELLHDLTRQTIRDRMEVIIVDAASPTDEGAIVREFQKEFNNIVYTRTRERETAHASVNRAFSMARGRYITPAATDDRHHPEAFERLVAALESDPGAILAYADCAVTTQENARLEDGPIAAHFRWPEFDPRHLWDVCYVGPQPLYRRELHELYGGYPEEFVVAGDYELWLRVVAAGERFRHVPEVLGLYLQNLGGNEYGNQDLCFEESERAREMHWIAAWGPRPQPGTSHLVPVNSGEPDRGPGLPVRLDPRTGSASLSTEASAVPAANPHPGLPARPARGNEPLVSVIIPTKDRESFLARAVLSVLSQTLEDLEIIVVNDGGSEVARMLRGLDSRGRITSIDLPVSRERSAARNAGAAIARGTYLCWLDDDDFWDADHLESLVGFLESTGEAVVYGDARRHVEVLDENAADVTYRPERMEAMPLPDFQRDSLFVGNFIPVNCIVHRRECFDLAGGFDETLSTHEDWDLWLRISQHFHVHHVARATANISWREDGSTTTSSRAEDFLRTCEIIHARYAPETAGRPELQEAQRRYRENLLSHFVRPEESPERARQGETSSGEAALSPPSGNDEDGQDPLAEIKHQISEGHLDEARSRLEQHLLDAQEDAEAWLTRGVLGVQEGNWKDAERSFRAAEASGSEPRRTRLGLGMTALGSGDTASAWELFSNLAEENTGDAEVIHWLLRTGTILERWSDLVVPLERHVAAAEDDLASYFALAGVYLRADRPEEAREACSWIEGRDPEFEGLAELRAALPPVVQPVDGPMMESGSAM